MSLHRFLFFVRCDLQIDPDVALQYKNAVGLQYQQLMKDIMKVKQELFKVSRRILFD